MPFFCCFKRQPTVEAPQTENYLERLLYNQRSLYHNTVCNEELNKKWAAVILMTEHIEMYKIPLMLLRPGPSKGMVTFDTISKHGKIESRDLEMTVIDNELLLSGKPAHEYLEQFAKTHETVFLTDSTLAKIEERKLEQSNN